MGSKLSPRLRTDSSRAFVSPGAARASSRGSSAPGSTAPWSDCSESQATRPSRSTSSKVTLACFWSRRSSICPKNDFYTASIWLALSAKCRHCSRGSPSGSSRRRRSRKPIKGRTLHVLSAAHPRRAASARSDDRCHETRERPPRRLAVRRRRGARSTRRVTAPALPSSSESSPKAASRPARSRRAPRSEVATQSARCAFSRSRVFQRALPIRLASSRCVQLEVVVPRIGIPCLGILPSCPLCPCGYFKEDCT